MRHVIEETSATWIVVKDHLRQREKDLIALCTRRGLPAVETEAARAALFEVQELLRLPGATIGVDTSKLR